MAIAVDDYGTIRLHSKSAREKLQLAGLELDNRFDQYDTLETREDLEALFEVLRSVKDADGQPAVFTPYALSCNPDFEAIRQSGSYHYQPLTETFAELAAEQPAAYEGAWQMWQAGMDENLMAPQFHGREHLNLHIIEDKMRRQDADIMACMEHCSMAGLDTRQYPKTIGWTAAFSFYAEKEVHQFPAIMDTGLKAFREVYGFQPSAFTAPAQQFPPVLEKRLPEWGINFFDRPFHQKRHVGKGKLVHQFHSNRYNPKQSKGYIVRNVLFEPNNGKQDHPGQAMRQIEAAFYWNKPAIISSHRVNFCGHIDETNRTESLRQLKDLLQRIVRKWPDVEFVSVYDISTLMTRVKNTTR